MLENKIKYGLCNVHYAVIGGDSTHNREYGVMKRIEGAVSISLSQVGESIPVYGDNIEYFTFNMNNGYDGTIEFVLLPDDFRVDILGEIRDVDGIQYESSESVKPVEFALLFQFEGDIKNKKHVLYRCKCTRPNIESSTKADKPDIKNEILNITVRPHRTTKYIKAFTTLETDSSKYDRWFTGVFPDLIPEISVTSSAGSEQGSTEISVSPALNDGHSYVYKTAEKVEYPAIGSICDTDSGWFEWNGSDDITAVKGNEIVIVEVDSSESAVRAGKTIIVGV